MQALLCERGINVTHEALRQWRRKLGQDYANRLRRRRTYPSASRILSRMSRPRIAAVVYGIFREIFCLDFGHF